MKPIARPPAYEHPPEPETPGLVARAYYAVMEVKAVPERAHAVETPFAKKRFAGWSPGWLSEAVPVPHQRFFWAAWWSGDRPKLDPWRQPDDCGFVVGPQAHAHAISEADSAIRRGGKGRKVHALPLPETFAKRAFTMAATTRVSPDRGLRRQAMVALELLGLTLAAKPDDVRKAFRHRVRDTGAHPDRSGGTADEYNALTQAREVALKFVEALARKREFEPEKLAQKVSRRQRSLL